MEIRVQNMVRECVGRTMLDPTGETIGTIQAVYVDDRTAQPEWFAVGTGWFGNHVSFVPIRGTDVNGADVQSLYSRDTVKDSPHVEPSGHLTSDEQRALYNYYDVTDVAPIGDDTEPPVGAGSEHAPDLTNPAPSPSELLRDDSGDVPLTDGPAGGTSAAVTRSRTR